MRKIRKGDNIIILTGRDKGKRGTVLRMVKDDALVVQGLNMVKKHQKPNPMRGVAGGIIEKEMPLHISNVAIFNPVRGSADRVGFKILEDRRKVRIYRSSGEPIDS